MTRRVGTHRQKRRRPFPTYPQKAQRRLIGMFPTYALAAENLATMPTYPILTSTGIHAIYRDLAATGSFKVQIRRMSKGFGVYARGPI